MEVQFTNTVCSSLDLVLGEVSSGEQTQEIKLSDSLPDVGRVVSAWGQSILRSKEWNGSHISCSAGMMVWVLYAPEDGSQPRVLGTWIPFQLRWELPENTPEGIMRVRCLTRSVDARSVSPRKILVRAGMGALAQAYVPQKTNLWTAARTDQGIELLKKTYPVRLRKEAGEKIFQLDEALTLPESAPALESIVYCHMEPKAQDVRVLADKLVFRGAGKLHVLYRSTQGQLHSWDFSLPFSQYAVLDNTYGSDAQADPVFCVTALEPELEENGTLRVKCGVVCQYVITDREQLELTEDAYSPGWEVETARETPTMDLVLDRWKETLYPGQSLQLDADVAADVCFLPDFPRQRRGQDGTVLQCTGTFQVLCCGPDGTLRSGSARWEGEQQVAMAQEGSLYAMPESAEAAATVGNGTVTATAEYPVSLEASADQPFSMVTAVKTGQPRRQDASRPSLILRRAGSESLWELAKNNGSTMDAIRRANGLQEEPVGNQMLLIPVL